MTALDTSMLVSGALLFAYTAATLFFLRFWKRTGDRLFVMFALSFAVLAIQRLMIAFSDAATEDLTHLYMLRLAAFVVILWAIIDKNRSRAQASG